MLFKSVFIVSKSRSHVVKYSFKFILPCNYIYIYTSWTDSTVSALWASSVQC